MTTYTYNDASLNLWVKNTKTGVMSDLTTAADADVHIMGVQERSSTTTINGLHDWVAKRSDRWGLLTAGESGIVWRKDIFGLVPKSHQVTTVWAAKKGVCPERVIEEATFVHLKSKKKINYANTHWMQAYAEADKDFDPKNYDFRRNGAARHSYVTQELTGRWLREKMGGQYDFVRYGGDLNLPLTVKQTWWYPGNILSGPYRTRTGTWGSGIDHILYSKNSAVSYGKLRKLPVKADHPLRIQEIGF